MKLVPNWQRILLRSYSMQWTICYGHTRTVIPGETRSLAECNALLAEELIEYREGLHAYFTSETIQRRLTPERDTAYTSLAFNVGIAGVAALGVIAAFFRFNGGKP